MEVSIFAVHGCEFYRMLSLFAEARGGAVGWDTAIQIRSSRVRFLMVLLEFLLDIILPAAQWSWVRLRVLTERSVRNISWWGKGGRCQGLTTLLPSYDDCLLMWEPEAAGTLRGAV
jgi:hypothetical protein